MRTALCVVLRDTIHPLFASHWPSTHPLSETDWLAIESQGASCLCLPRARTTSMPCWTLIATWLLGIKPSSCVYKASPLPTESAPSPVIFFLKNKHTNFAVWLTTSTTSQQFTLFKMNTTIYHILLASLKNPIFLLLSIF